MSRHEPAILRRARKLLRQEETELNKLKHDTFQKYRKNKLRQSIKRHKLRVENLERMWKAGEHLPYVC